MFSEAHRCHWMQWRHRRSGRADLQGRRRHDKVDNGLDKRIPAARPSAARREPNRLWFT
jgi:hypothetical protein